jgi:FkbM family methyltransferase
MVRSIRASISRLVMWAVALYIVQRVVIAGIIWNAGMPSSVSAPSFSTSCPRRSEAEGGAAAFYTPSSFAQDRIIYEAFYSPAAAAAAKGAGSMCDGKVFLDVGAKDGRDGSNSWFFEQYLGWRCYEIEGDERHFALLEKFRPLSVNIWAAVSKEYGEAEWIADGILSGGQSGLRMSKSIKEDTNMLYSSIKKVRTTPISTVLSHFALSHVDVMSLDVEGAELAVLETVDFRKVTIDVLTIECNEPTSEKCAAVRALLGRNGYELWRTISLMGAKGAPPVLRTSPKGFDEVWVRSAFLAQHPAAPRYEGQPGNPMEKDVRVVL